MSNKKDDQESKDLSTQRWGRWGNPPVHIICHFNLITCICICILYLFICHTITIITKKCQKKCRKKWRGGLKETIELMLIRPPQLQFFEDGIKITATDTK